MLRIALIILVLSLSAFETGCAARGELTVGYNGDNGETAQVKIYVNP